MERIDFRVAWRNERARLPTAVENFNTSTMVLLKRCTVNKVPNATLNAAAKKKFRH